MIDPTFNNRKLYERTTIDVGEVYGRSPAIEGLPQVRDYNDMTLQAILSPSRYRRTWWSRLMDWAHGR